MHGADRFRECRGSRDRHGFYQPPLSISGVLVGLLVKGSTINIFSVIGFIRLIGLVTKNVILPVHQANKRPARRCNMCQSRD
ncbi:efflux RND transporter permease subunit [Rhizobium sp. JAB6]|uniref:efflux RND transporter permease subunit n=1 Tax=Rhizobium sp. JAB6 TaxID=2127050 RepID=UPI001FDF9512|nr:efflux RND transporter permease subunit [Rhizobium sp. JAB6]